ncbi:MAG: formyltransferase family protein [Dissulfurispiraceae bacterium]
MKVLFLAKQRPFSDDAAGIIKSNFSSSSRIIFGSGDEPFPAQLLTDNFDYIISYISPWIVPGQVLGNAKIAAINLHPGPPEYPGIGCTNFALYNNEKDFGITVHHMNEKVDTGRIIMVKRFPIFNNDTVYSLTQRCYSYVYVAFIEMISFILEGKSLPASDEQWKREPFTRKELNALCEVSADMSDYEIKRRIKATTYPGMPGAFVRLSGNRFLADNSSK